MASNSGGSQCTAFAACGGDLVGRWKITRACPSAEELQKIANEVKFCSASVATVQLELSGSCEFDAQGAVKIASNSLAHVAEGVPSSCSMGVGQDCSIIQAAIASKPATNGVSCEASAAGCDCVYDLTSARKQQSSYAAAGSSYIETDPSDGSKSSSEYCVEGASLRVKDESGVLELVRDPQ